MINYILLGIICFLFGIIIFYMFSKLSSKDSYNQTIQTVFLNEMNEFKRHIEELKKQTELNSFETKNAIQVATKLTNILTTNQNVKGQFGQDCLENIIKACFPNDNIDYIKQASYLNEDSQNIRPDFVVNLPNNNKILIDCKLNLEKYIDYKDNQDKKLDEMKKAEFIKDMNNTINLLANKKYETANGISQPDFILMYIPLEPVITCLYTNPDFLSVIKNAALKNIIIVGNSSVLTVIRLVKTLWAKQAQDDNVENIIDMASKIYELVAKHSNFLYELKTDLQQSVDKFNKEFDKFQNDSVLFKTVQKLQAYGIKIKSKKVGKQLNDVEINSAFLK